MAKYKVGGNLTIQVDDSGNQLRDITAHVTEIDDFGKEYLIIDDTGIADTAESCIAGIEASQEFAVRGFLDDTATTGSDTVLSGIIGTIVSVKIMPKSSVRSFAAECLCVSYKANLARKEYIMFEARFKQDGAVSVGTT